MTLIRRPTTPPPASSLKAWGPAVTAAATHLPDGRSPLRLRSPTTPTTTSTACSASPRHCPRARAATRVTETACTTPTAAWIRSSGRSARRWHKPTPPPPSANGLPVTLTDAKGNRTTYEYDGHDRRVKLRLPHPHHSRHPVDHRLREQYGYNAVGSLTSHRKRSGETVTFAYDNLHRLSSRSYPTAADNVAFAYDLLGTVAPRPGTPTTATPWPTCGCGRAPDQHRGRGKTLAYQYRDAAGQCNRLERALFPVF